MTEGNLDAAAEKLAALTEQLQGPSLFALLQINPIKGRPEPTALAERIADVRSVLFELASHLPAPHPVRSAALERMKSVERLLEDPLEWHLLSRAIELRQDPGDAGVRATIEAAFLEEHVPKAVWLNSAPDGAHAEVRKSLRLTPVAEVDVVHGGNPIRVRSENLSRDGICVDVPADFDGKAVKLVLHLANGAREAQVTGAVVWRRGARVGVSFSLPPADQALIDSALQAYFAALRGVAERWLALRPEEPAAIACACLVGYFSSVLPSNRQPFVEKLVTAAQSQPRSEELQLALARIRLEERDFAAAEASLRRAATGALHDSRYTILVETLAQRRGSPTRLDLLAGQARRAGGGARTALAATVGVGLVAALTWALVVLRSPFEEAPVPPGGLPCERIERLDENALCFIDTGAYHRIPAPERARLARATLRALAGKHVSMITVYAADAEDVLDTFHELTLADLEK